MLIVFENLYDFNTIAKLLAVLLLLWRLLFKYKISSSLELKFSISFIYKHVLESDFAAQKLSISNTLIIEWISIILRNLIYALVLPKIVLSLRKVLVRKENSLLLILFDV